jgi:glycosyltransferase involved in cell wall biosynthesis
MVATFPTPHHLPLCRGRIRGDLPLHHLPHAAAAGSSLPWQDRDIPILVCGAVLADPKQTRAGWAAHGRPVQERLEAILAGHQRAPRRPLHDIVLETLGDQPVTPELLYSYFSVVDSYLRRVIRTDLLQAAGTLPITLVGPGWDALIPADSSIRLLGEQPAAAVLGLMARAKLVVNALPAYYESHERPFQAMAHGAAAATVVAPWLNEAVGLDALCPLPDSPAAAAETLAAALGQDGDLAALAARGRAAFIDGQTWDHRLDQLLSWIQDTAAISATR